MEKKTFLNCDTRCTSMSFNRRLKIVDFAMNYYVIQVKTNKEATFLKAAKKDELLKELNFTWIRKLTRIRKCGSWKKVIVSLFPGYLFLGIKNESTNLFLTIKNKPGFIRFLPANNNILPLSSADREIFKYFLSFGQLIDKSRVIYTKNMRIQVISGPLKGLEGNIVKVDRRKRKAKILIEFFKNSFYITLDFDVINDRSLQC